MTDPVINTPIEENKQKSPGVFGGGEDVFDNTEIFAPIAGQRNHEVGTELIDQTSDIKENDDIDRGVNADQVIHQEVLDEVEDFDPIFGSNSNQGGSENKYERDDNDKEKIIENNVGDDVVIRNNEEEQKIEKEPEGESDLMKKFNELVKKTKELYEIAQMEDSQYVELVGGDTGKSQVIYNLRLVKEDGENDAILISKIETDKQTNEQQQNNLEFKNNEGSLEILLDEQLLYDEEKDLREDTNKRLQVTDKLNKFIFLVSEELKIYERDRKEREKMEQERKKLRDIFRNF